MASCAHCGTVIVFGGIREGGDRFCREQCHRAFRANETELSLYAECERKVVDDSIRAEAVALHSGSCPLCGGQGPIDGHESSWVISVPFYHNVKRNIDICCEGCAHKTNFKASIITLFLGWWSISGAIQTAIVLVRNLRAFAMISDPFAPSERLAQELKRRAVEQMVDRRRQQEQQQDEQTGSLS